jgi:hypothetical protein
MSTRQDIATVLDGLTVDPGDGGEPIVLAAYPQLPDSIGPYTAWPVWASTAWLTRCVSEDTWQVLVALPASSSDAWADSGDLLLDPVRDALSKVGGVTRAEPVALAVGDQSQTVPALAFTLDT